MRTKFNRGKAYHGSSAVTEGKLKGATDTDYFYFFCPVCEGKQIMRLLDYEVREEQPDNPYNDLLKSKAIKGFTLAFKLHCEKCDSTDFVKVSNLGWQCGDFESLNSKIGSQQDRVQPQIKIINESQ
ncbi:MAG: hypothetical protein EBU46_04165 [Nitrosomonadaceae bacterium]|nr:hypothetical protein [Nitrosomonadaceae bacterium]